MWDLQRFRGCMFSIEGEVVEEIVLEETVAEEIGLVSMVGLVEGQAVEGEAEKHWKDLPRGHQCRTALRTSFSRLPLRCFSSLN